jgi:sugar phosphate permease
MLLGMTDPETPEPAPARLTLAWFTWTPTLLALAMVWDGTHTYVPGIIHVDIEEIVWGVLIGLVGLFSSLSGLHIAFTAEGDLRDRSTPHWGSAMFAAVSNLAGLAILAMALVVLSSSGK